MTFPLSHRHEVQDEGGQQAEQQKEQRGNYFDIELTSAETKKSAF